MITGGKYTTKRQCNKYDNDDMPRKYDYHCNSKTNEQVIQTTPEIKDMNTRLGVKARIELRKEF